MTLPTQNRRFHGWNVLALCTFCQFIAVGCTMYLIGLYIDPMAEALSATRGQIGSASAIFVASGALLGPLLGYWADRGKTRELLLLGAVTMGLGFAALSQVITLLQATMVCLLLLAPGCALLGAIPTTVMVAQWFTKRRGLAIGITAAGISFGGFVMPLLVAWLQVAFDWRGSLLAIAGIIGLILLPAVWFTAVAKPSELGQHPDGAADLPADVAAAVEGEELTSAQIFRDKDFWLLSVAVGVLCFFGVLIVTYIAPYAKDAGLSVQSSAFMISLYALFGIIGKFSFGWLCDQFSPHRLLAITLVIAALGWLPILFSQSVGAFWITAGAVGFAMGGLLPVWSSLIALLFGLANFGRVRGFMSLSLIIFTILPGPVGGYLYDSTGSYVATFSALWLGLPLGVLVSLFVSKPSLVAVNAANKK